ncbi:collagenase [Micromonospora chalcea]|uniref:collagenase n=1 Tax=Micromonospora chalcea TaxID=1874 RepID=UPI000CE34E99|nr:collagenase [Micromonospora chalcea]PPA56651.1 microbial collagenase, secreted [Micromonospora chalcea]
MSGHPLRRRLGQLFGALTALTLACGVIAPPAAANSARPVPPGQQARKADAAPPAAGDATVRGKDRVDHVSEQALPVHKRPPQPAAKDAARVDYDRPATPKRRARPSDAGSRAAAAACSTADFTSRTGAALVSQIKGSTVDCINSLFSLSGSDAYNAFREAQMASVAYAVRDGSPGYPGNPSTGMPQLVLYLRAGYYVQWYDTSVGTYGAALQTAIRSALDAFFANPRAWDVTDANGETLAEAVTLIDSAQENARYLFVVNRLLTGFNSSYTSSWYMLNAVNNVYTVLFRGHQVPAFVSAVQADRTVLDNLYNFANTHAGLLGTDNGYLTSNAGRELGRFLQHAPLSPIVRPMASALLSRSNMTGPTAPLWVGVAEMTQAYDVANCSYYTTCNLSAQLTSSVLTINYTCSPSIKIVAQDMTSAELSQSCTSLKGQDAYFHSLVADSGPVAGDVNTDIEVVVFNSSTDYQTYAGAIYGIDTNNGGMYLEGNPSDPNNQARFIAYEAEWVRPAFQIWNLNHEYTHYLDGRFNMYGDFSANITTPTIWWIEGFAEYVSYSYRNVTYTSAQNQAGNHTYALRTLFDTTYNNDQTRIYNWGYLAVRYMMQSHRPDMTTVLGYYRSGAFNAARTYLTSTIGSRYDADFDAWLTRCAAGDCGGSTTPPPTNQPPSASFTVTTSGLTATFTDRSTDADGSIASRQWAFGDGSTSSAVNPSKTYATAGTYTVSLTVTDNQGATARSSQTISVTTGGGTTVPECSGTDTRTLDRNCQRSGRSATAGNYDYLYIYLPAGVSTLTIAVAGGTGNCDLYYSPSSWATTSNATRSSAGAGNTESLAVPSPAAGYHYISLYGKTACSGATVSTRY